MELSNLIFLQQAPGRIESILSSIVPFLLIIFDIFYFLILRLQQRKDRRKSQAA
ncbi:MAG: hypothetical protein IPM96_19780 [Ignavibacteria bacterium]|nr:hypothetical protein [Ignavibacteria bacterium]